MNLYLWKKSKWENADDKVVRSKKEEDIFIVKRKKRKNAQVY